MNYYFDTCIWRDYYENRNDNFRPLGEWALALINKIQKEKNKILYSSIVVRKLKGKYDLKEINQIFSVANTFLIQVEYNYSQIQEAKITGSVRNTGFSDALHVILARDNNAIMITRDEHFLEFIDIAEIKKPEELI
ncbi:MAG: hypothetical protein WC254_02790 [Candidatus Woesearchaeota archaeon]|jgi:predicted nucleic acid-binding protein